MPEDVQNIELRSEEVQEILEAVPTWMIRWGNTLVLLLILMLLCMSWFIKYPDVIETQAIVTTQIPPQKEYAKISGKFNAILVKDNQHVTPNQPLAILENAANFKDVFYLKSIIDTIPTNQRENFNFPLDSLPMLFLGDIETNYSLFENSFIQYQLNKQLQPFSNEALANSLSVSELNGRLQSLRAQRELNLLELDLKKKNLERNKGLYEKGIISLQDYENRQIEYAQAESNFKNINLSFSQLRESMSNARKSSKATQINKTKEDITLLKSVIQSFNQLKNSIKDWELQYVLKSNINGNVSFLNYWNENQTVNQGDLVFTVIPSENSAFIAKLKSPAQNSGKLKIGQTVNINLENYPDTEFGTLKGAIKNISAVPDKEGYYLIDVQLPKTLITSYKKAIDFKQDMRGSAEIITEDLRLIERFFYQLKNVFKS